MIKAHQDILDNLHEGSNLEPLHLNSRVLLIDSMNTFLRSFAIIPAINPQGNHIGGILQIEEIHIQNIRLIVK